MRINGKEYRIPEIGFKAVKSLSEHGVSLFDLNFKRDFLIIISAFVSLSTGLDTDEADDLIEQHLLGGGSFDDWIKEITQAVETSPFLRAMEKKQKKAKLKEAEPESVDNQ